ncbi:succinate dehydrogenase assembly factor 3, mitochondrial-like [Lingula anatina]|uniref:Succinate dehydrogenase assembly factor 3 n=1 Tax=Lingula anatina TaxID=7574 RepID=A0A1S3H7W1_LINAN|nr:succinate dehydrogenase assembly factor 3, mitochondrial-like [Lingula anatina]|eukprot:XP_013381214.1 succinate dehydrogenase assembly factor 3, mitochondrial-like [Lingula anatina]
MPSNHLSRVRLLYKTIIRLHKGLPDEMRYLGDSYVKEEFKRHKTAEPEVAAKFLEEWTKYAYELSKQLGPKGIKKNAQIGKQLSEDILHTFREDQLNQLYYLGLEATGQADNEEDIKELEKKVDEMQAPDNGDDTEETKQR